MCGIAGVVDFTAPSRALAPRTERMTSALAHRGPDGRGLYCAPRHGVTLGHTRLALLDLAHGAQPFVSPDGCHALVYNGEIYNHASLRDELATHWEFRTRSDTEVLLAALVHWGDAALTRLEGMFAFFYWNDRDGEGLAARDALGVKPFVYRLDRPRDGVRLAFASEAKALLDELPSRRVDRDALVEYLVAPFFSGVERAAFEGLSLLAPGHLLRVDRERVVRERWYTHRLEPDRSLDEDTLARGLRHRLEHSVLATLRADVPVGLFLSGGLDSTAIATFAARDASPPLCFTVTFDEMHAYDYAKSTIVTGDDTPFAREAAQRLGLAAIEVPVSRRAIEQSLDEIARVDDALPAWEQEIAQWHLARAASRHRKAVLVGDAADETHYGYHFLLDERATASPRAILERFHPAPLARDFAPDPVASLDTHYRNLAEQAGYSWDHPRARLLATTHLIISRWLPRLLHNGDVHTMAHGLEARVPFADPALLALARRVAPESALRSGREKALLREALRGVVAEPLRLRKKSALPKDQGTGAIYQRTAREALASQRALLARVLNLATVEPLADPARTPPERLTEGERALLFRVTALAHWASHYRVAPP